MKSALIWGVGLTFLVVGACTTEVQNKPRTFTGITSASGAAVEESCDDPAKYGADCSGEHDSAPMGSSDQEAKVEEPAAEKPAETPATPPPAAPAGDPNIVMFSIPAGTGEGGWNTAATMINAKVGQTIKIVNNDTVNHYLHTGGAPCPHGRAAIPPGGTMDCPATRAITTNANNPQTYDHLRNANTAPVFFNVVP